MELDRVHHEENHESEIKERLMGCIALEHSMSEFYSALAARFQAEAGFFIGLAEDEINHAMTLEAGELLGRIGETETQLIPPAASLIRNTIAAVERIKADMSISAVSLEEALNTAIMLESSSVERFYIQVADESKGTQLQKYLMSIIAEERGHIDKLRSRMMDLGMKKPS